MTVITVTESPMLYLPTKEDLVNWEAARKEFAGKVLDEARAMAEQTGISANSCMFLMITQPLRLSKQQSAEAAT